MKVYLLSLFIITIPLTAISQIKLDSAISAKIQGNDRILSIEYEKNYYTNGAIESQGVIFKSFYYPITGQNKNSDTIKTKIGHWLQFHKNGKVRSKSYIPFYSDSAYIEATFYNKKGEKIVYKKYLYSEEVKSLNLNLKTFGVARPEYYFYRTYHKNGHVKYESHEKKKSCIGVAKYYYQNGQLYKELNYNSDGYRHGPTTIYHENGTIKVEKYFDMYSKVGTWKYYDETGQLIKEKNYDRKDG